MQLAGTTFMEELAEIESQPDIPIVFSYRLELKAGRDIIGSHKVLGLDIIRNYRENWADEIIVQAIFSVGTYYEKIVPMKSQITAVIYRTPIGSIANAQELGIGISSETYRATLIELSDEQIASNYAQLTKEEQGNHLGFKMVSFQLQSQAAERFRTWMLGIPAQNQNPGKVLEAALNAIKDAINVQLTEKIRGVTMVEPNNQSIRRHVIVPHGTEAVKIPHFLQNKCGGIYSSGLSFYLQDLMFYVWPTYDITRFYRARETVTFMIVPPNQRPGQEKTWRKTPRSLFVLITGGVQHIDNTEGEAYNAGVGVRYSKASSALDGLRRVSGNRTTIDRSVNNSEYVSVDRGPNNLRYSPQSPRKITDNPYRESSELAARAGGFLMVTWQNSYPELLKPDMPVKVMYSDKDGIPKELNGTLIESHTYVEPVQIGLIDQRHQQVTTVEIFVQKDRNEALSFYEGDVADTYTPPKDIN